MTFPGIFNRSILLCSTVEVLKQFIIHVTVLLCFLCSTINLSKKFSKKVSLQVKKWQLFSAVEYYNHWHQSLNLTVPLNSCVTLEKLLHFSKLVFLPLKDKDNIFQGGYEN